MKRRLLYWATSYAVTGPQLFIGWKWRKYLRENEICNPQTIWGVCGRVFKYAMYLVVKDIIENKTMFRFPTSTGATLQMMATSGEDFIKARQNGAFEDVDFLASNFTAYTLQLEVKTRYHTWYKRVYVTHLFRDRIVELTNKGESW